MHSVIREEIFKLCRQLSCKRFIMRNNQRRFLEMLNNIRHRKRFSCSRSSKKRYFTFTFGKNILNFFDRSNLISGWLVGGLKFEHVYVK